MVGPGAQAAELLPSCLHGQALLLPRLPPYLQHHAIAVLEVGEEFAVLADLVLHIAHERAHAGVQG